MEQNAVVSGDLDVTGRITSGAISTSGDLVRTGSLSATASAVTLQQPTTVNKTLTVKENADFFKDLSMNGNSVKMEKPGQIAVSMIAQNDRMEFFVNGKLKFYIDENGGHNA